MFNSYTPAQYAGIIPVAFNIIIINVNIIAITQQYMTLCK